MYNSLAFHSQAEQALAPADWPNSPDADAE